MSIQKIQGAKLNIAKVGLKPLAHSPKLEMYGHDPSVRRVNFSDPHTDALELADFTANSRHARTTLLHNENGSGRVTGTPRR